MVVGSNDHIVSTDSGATWSESILFGQSLNSVASSADGSRWICVSDTGIYAWTHTNTPTPLLSLTSSDSDALVSWIIPSQDFALQQSSDLSNWSDVTTPPVLNLTNLQNQVSVSPTNTAGFYRLKH